MWNDFPANSHQFPLKENTYCSSRTQSLCLDPSLGVEAKGCLNPTLLDPYLIKELVIFALIRVCKLNSNLVESVERNGYKSMHRTLCTSHV